MKSMQSFGIYLLTVLTHGTSVARPVIRWKDLNKFELRETDREHEISKDRLEWHVLVLSMSNLSNYAAATFKHILSCCTTAYYNKEKSHTLFAFPPKDTLVSLNYTIYISFRIQTDTVVRYCRQGNYINRIIIFYFGFRSQL